MKIEFDINVFILKIELLITFYRIHATMKKIVFDV